MHGITESKQKLCHVRFSRLLPLRMRFSCDRGAQIEPVERPAVGIPGWMCLSLTAGLLASARCSVNLALRIELQVRSGNALDRRLHRAMKLCGTSLHVSRAVKILNAVMGLPLASSEAGRLSLTDPMSVESRLLRSRVSRLSPTLEATMQAAAPRPQQAAIRTDLGAIWPCRKVLAFTLR